MDSTLGIMGSSYEYVVTPKATGALRIKKMLLIALYILWGGGVLIVGAAVRIVAPLLAFIPLSLWILIWLTWKYTQVSYEYSFGSGTMKVNRLLGERTRRAMVEIKISNIEKYYTSDDDLNSLKTDKEFFVASSRDSERLIAIVWVDEEQKKNVLWFEADEKALKILHRYNSTVF